MLVAHADCWLPEMLPGPVCDRNVHANAGTNSQHMQQACRFGHDYNVQARDQAHLGP